jgi:hypothetical protein
MKRQLLKYALIGLLILPVFIFAQSARPSEQDMTGLWKGTLYNDSTNKFLPYQIAISEEKGKLVGYSYTMFEEDGKKEVGVKKIKLKIKDEQVIIEDVELISNNYSIPPPKKVRVQSILSLYLNDTSMQLSGRWSTNKTWEYRQLTGSLLVKRAIDYKQTALFEKLTELKLDKALSFVKPASTLPATDIAIKEKPVKENKLVVEAPAKPVTVDQPKEPSPASDAKTALVANNKPSDKDIANVEVPVSKTGIDIPTKPQPAADKTAFVAISDKPIEKTATPVSKMGIDKTTSTSNKKAVLPIPANEVAVNEKQPADQSITKTAPIEKPSAIAPSVNSKKTNLPVKDSIATNTSSIDIAAIQPADKPTSNIVPPLDKKKAILVAVNQNKPLVNQTAAINKPVTITPTPVAKSVAPGVAVKEPAKKEAMPVIAVAKQPVLTEKPIAIAAPKEPAKTETKLTAAIIVPQEKKKEIPVPFVAPVVIAAPIVLAAANVADRKMKNEHEVYFESDSLVLTLYDNGEVDGDTVSVLMNGKIIFAKTGLTAKANSKTIYINKNMSDSLSMVMYAENLGSIPPNTGLLIIMDGEKRYEVRFSADLQTNAAILLRRKQKEK